MKKCLSIVVMVLSTSSAVADTSARDIAGVLGQVSRIFGSAHGAAPSALYVSPGTRVKLDDGRLGEIYGFECAPGEQKPCGSVKVDNSSHRIMIVPAQGKPFEERWTFRKLNGNKLVFVRPKGQFVMAAQ